MLGLGSRISLRANLDLGCDEVMMAKSVCFALLCELMMGMASQQAVQKHTDAGRIEPCNFGIDRVRTLEYDVIVPQVLTTLVRSCVRLWTFWHISTDHHGQMIDQDCHL